MQILSNNEKHSMFSNFEVDFPLLVQFQIEIYFNTIWLRFEKLNKATKSIM